MQVDQFGKIPLLSELHMKIPIYSLQPEQVEADLDHAIKGGHKSRIDHGIELLRKSDLKTPKTLSVTFLVRDFEGGNGWQVLWKLGHAFTITV